MTAFKIVVGVISNSLGVISEGIHSSLDVVSAAIAFYTIREAGKEADMEHPFGHGKFETLSSLVESLLLWVAAGLIIYEGIRHLKQPEPIGYQALAIGVIAFSGIVSWMGYVHNHRAAKETESSAIEVNALHFLSDAVASLGVVLGLVIIHYTGWLWVDALMAISIGLYIIVISVKQIRGALAELSDTALPAHEVKKIEEILSHFKKESIEYHDLRTRKSGSHRHIDFHLVLCGHLSVTQSHELCDRMEDDLLKVFPLASIQIHVEPCAHKVPSCESYCSISLRKKS